MKKFKIKESELRNIINKLIKEQYDSEDKSIEIVKRLEILGIPDKFLEQALAELINIEFTRDSKQRANMLMNFKKQINILLEKFNIGRDEKETNIIMSMDIMLNKYLDDLIPTEPMFSLN